MKQEYQPSFSPVAAILFAHTDSVYKTFAHLDVYDYVRDARTYAGALPVIAHPPCRGWGRLRRFASPRPGEKDLALFAVDLVRQNGGVLEHPAHSTLWPAAGLPLPGDTDQWGGYTYPICQYQFGHRALKPTWLYICGLSAQELPPVPFALGTPPCVIGSSGRRLDGTRLKKGDYGWRPEVSRAEREHTPIGLATWLIQVAVLVTPPLCAMGGTNRTKNNQFGMVSHYAD